MAKKKTKLSKTPAAAAATNAAAAAVATPWTMHIQVVSVASLLTDPRNARLHNDKNLASIVASLRQSGQQKPLVVDGDGVVVAGNGTLAAATTLGWEQITIHRTHLTGAAARAYAIADNRTAELAEWDVDELNRSLDEIAAADIDIGDVGFSDAELAALADADFDAAHGFAPKKPKDDAPAAEQTITPQYKVVVTCKTEKEQAEIVTWLERRGADYKAPSV